MDISPQVLLLTAIQSFFSLWIVLLGLKMVGRRVFGELAPHDVVLIILVAEAMSNGLVPKESGFWGSVVSVLTLLVTVGVIQRVPIIREWLDGRPIVLMEESMSEPDSKLLKKYHVSEDDLGRVARNHGFDDISVFKKIILEADGQVSGILKDEYQKPPNIKPDEGAIAK